MIDINNFALFVASALVLNITPGPDIAFMIASTTKGGVRAGIGAALGVSAGCLGWAMLAAAGIAAVFAAAPVAMRLLQIAGGAYLIYLAVRTVLSGAGEKEPSSGDAGAHDGIRDSWAAFRAGFLTNMLNPKVGLFFLAFLPGFATGQSAPVWLQMLTLGAVFATTAFVVGVGIVTLIGIAQRKFARSGARAADALRLGSAAIFGALGGRLLVDALVKS